MGWLWKDAEKEAAPEEGPSAPLLPEGAAEQEQRPQEKGFRQQLREAEQPIKPQEDDVGQQLSSTSAEVVPHQGGRYASHSAPTVPQGSAPPSNEVAGPSYLYPYTAPVQQYPLRDQPRPYYVSMLCPTCGHHGPGRVSREAGFCTWFSCLACCLAGCVPCCWVPFCCSITKDSVVRCPVCRNVLGRRLA